MNITIDNLNLNVNIGEALGLVGKRLASEDIPCGCSYVNLQNKIIGNLTVAENIYIGQMGSFKRLIFTDKKRMNESAYALMKSLGICNIAPDMYAYKLNVGQKKLIEICRAIRNFPELLILEDVFYCLTKKQRNLAVNIIKKQKKTGGVLFLTEDFDLACEICDRVTDTSFPMQSMSKGQYNQKTEVSMRAVNICTDKLRNVSFKLYSGEVLGFVGLEGSGIESIGRVLIGDILPERGRITVRGHKIISVRSGKKLGMTYISDIFPTAESERVRAKEGELLVVDRTNISCLSGTTVYITYNEEKALYLCDRIFVLRDGEIAKEYKDTRKIQKSNIICEVIKDA